MSPAVLSRCLTTNMSSRPRKNARRTREQIVATYDYGEQPTAGDDDDDMDMGDLPVEGGALDEQLGAIVRLMQSAVCCVP